MNLVRYHGVLAPAARDRAQVVPGRPTTADAKTAKSEPPAKTSGSKGPKTRPRNYSWAELMRRVFEIDVLECPECRGRMRILASIHSPDAIDRMLRCLGLPARAPPVARADSELAIEAWPDW